MAYPRTYREAWERMQPPCISETWVPIRTVYADTVCWFCGTEIPKGKPGSSTGSRGTKAWWCKERDVCECLPCGSERLRAEEAGAREKQMALNLNGGGDDGMDRTAIPGS